MKRAIVSLLCLCFFVPQLARATVRYKIYDLGKGEANAINDAGQVAGVYSFDGGRRHGAFIWGVTSGVRDLSILIDPAIKSLSSEAHNINNAGQVVGRFTPAHSHAFFWSEAAGMQILGEFPGSLGSIAHGINNIGQIVGACFTYQQYNIIGDACLWSLDSMSQFSTLPGQPDAWAEAINDLGQVVGYSSSSPGNTSAWLREPNGSVKDLGNLPGSSGPTAVAVAINNLGQVTGWSGGSRNISGAYIWSAETGMVSIGKLPGHLFSLGKSINDKGEIVGYSFPDNIVDERPIYWSKQTGMVELPRLSSRSANCNDINNAGVIAGSALAYDGEHAVLWLPVMDVQIDIKPDDLINNVNPRSNAVVPVAVLSTAMFNAGEIVPSTVLMAGAKPIRWHMEDVDGDGDSDLLLFFKVKQLNLSSGKTVLLTGITTTPRSIEGIDSINIVP